ncbi:MAG: preprotein translocase subunit YajC [Candidatus Omnitrophica bacterium]|nr:preprotein translocase subunit YajC [Candidatus Omnitrophota bacterium]MCM8826826.1 preprotein translocase subunit YajC [Candidatus Omnitrophota bacterium]
MPSNPSVGFIQILPLLFFLFIFYIMLIKPQQKKQREHQKMIESITKNDEVVTIGGIHGVVVNVKEKTFVLRVDDNTKIEVDKNCISYLKKKKDVKSE